MVRLIMSRLIAVALVSLALGFASGQSEAQSVPPGFVGMNMGGDVTVAPGANGYNTGPYPNFSRFDRIYDALANGGATPHATWWSTLQPTNTTPTWTTLDAILSAEAAKKRKTEYTFSGVPSWVNGTQNLTTSGHRASYTSFLTAMFAHIAANHQCFGFYSHWNEVNQPSTYWVGTAGDLATVAALAYPIIKAACPRTVVLSPSITSGVDTGSSPDPDGPFQYLSDYLAACPTCQDAINVHGYPMGYFSQTTDNTLRFQPENIVNIITNALAVAGANGLGALPLYIDEGYGLADPASTSEPANTYAYAAAQAAQLLIAASGGVSAYANSFWGAGCLSPSTACGNEYANRSSANLTLAGRAKRAVGSWLAGATFPTPIARLVGSNLIAEAPNDASAAVGLLAGSGTGCSSPPGGTGSLPSTWALSATASIAGGMSYYVVGTGTSGGKAYIDLRICGTDTSAANSDFVRMDNFTAAAAQGDDVVLAACLGLGAGSLTGVAETNLQINEYTAVPAYAGQFMSQSAILPVSTASVGVASQCYQTRYTIKDPSAALAEPYIVVKHYQNVAVDLTLRIAAPRLDNGAVTWKGAITKTGGYSATIAWVANGTGTITAPAGTTDWRGVYDGVHPVSPGDTIPLTQAPILIENTPPKWWAPVSTPAFVVTATGGNDLNFGTKASPFATLNKCHTAMQASATIKQCDLRAGSYSPGTLTMGVNETWTTYPGDPQNSAVITGASVNLASGVTINGISTCNVTFDVSSTTNVTIGNSSIGSFSCGSDSITGFPTTGLTLINNDFTNIAGVGPFFTVIGMNIDGNHFDTCTPNDCINIPQGTGHTGVPSFIRRNVFLRAYKAVMEVGYNENASGSLWTTNLLVDHNWVGSTQTPNSLRGYQLAFSIPNNGANSSGNVISNNYADGTAPDGPFLNGNICIETTGSSTTSNNQCDTFDYGAVGYGTSDVTCAPAIQTFTNNNLSNMRVGTIASSLGCTSPNFVVSGTTTTFTSPPAQPTRIPWGGRN